MDSSLSTEKPSVTASPRGDPDNSVHIISAWASGSGLSLGQLVVDGKSNEITAVPKLLRQIDVKGATVSLDAMGCQKKIAQEKKGRSMKNIGERWKKATVASNSAQ